MRPITPVSVETVGAAGLSGRGRAIVGCSAFLVIAAGAFLLGNGVPRWIALPDWGTASYYLAGNGIGVWMIAKAVNVDIGGSGEGTSTHAAAADLELLARPADLVADLLIVVERLRFSVQSLRYDPASGAVALRASRVRLLRGWPQYLEVHGALVEGFPSSLTVRVDSAIRRRLDFDYNRDTLEAIVQHFARSSEPPR